MAIQVMTTSFIVGLLVYALPASGDVITASCSNMTYQAAANPSEQFGYNLCNATTETQSSLCQTGFINALDDFCLWGPADATDLGPLSDAQLQQTVAFCTRPGHGTRVIPVEVFFWVSYVKTPSYIEVYGLFDGSVNMGPINYLYTGSRDLIAQLDPRGVNGHGDPIGGLMYSNAFNSSHGQSIQAVEWFSLIGVNFFYLRACDPNVPGSAAYCQRWDDSYYSWIDAAFPGWNTDALILNNTYLECLGDSTPLGRVIDESGSTVTYTGQPVSLRTPLIYPPATTSSCTTYPHSELFQTIPSSISPGAEVCRSTIPSKFSSGQRIGVIIGMIMGVLALLIGFFILHRWWRNTNNIRVDPGQRFVQMQPVEDEIGRWADENRMYITPELEQKLRAASYFPWDDPDTIPADVWQNRHNIGHYELMRMQELYAIRPKYE